MKIFGKILSVTKNGIEKIWGCLGIYTTLAFGIALIAGANGFVLAYIPITFLAVPVASAGTLVGTLLVSKTFFNKKNGNEKVLKEAKEEGKREAEQERKLQDNAKEIENLKLARDRYKSKCEHLERMGATITSFNPSLKIVLWDATYDMTDFKEDIKFTPGKSTGFGKRDKNPTSEKLQSVIRLKGKLHYCLNLEKLKVRPLNNRLYFPENLESCFEIIKETTTHEQLLWQKIFKEWDQDKELKNEEEYTEKGKLEKTVVENQKRIGGNLAQNLKHFEEAEKMLRLTHLNALQHLAEQQIKALFSTTGYKIIFNSKKLCESDTIDVPKFIKDFNQNIQEIELS